MQRHLGLKRPWCGVYLSDLHWAPWCSPLLQQIEQTLSHIQPEALLWGGDFIDLPWPSLTLRNWLGQLPYPSFAIAGNHDLWCGLRRQDWPLHWLDEPVLLDCQLRLCGHFQQGGDSQSLLVAHYPSHFAAAARAGFLLMCAGHWHGSQCTFFRWRERDYPGAAFFPYHGTYFCNWGCEMFVSRGLNDQIPIRWNCPRDLIVLELT